MGAENRTAADLLAENAEVRFQLAELQETLDAIRNGAVDALVVAGEAGERVYSLKGAESAYRVLVETMEEGAATLAADHTILYCNARFAELLRLPLEKLMGSSLRRFVTQPDLPAYEAVIGRALHVSGKCEVALLRTNADPVPVQLSCSPLDVQGARGACVIATDLTEQKRNAEIAAAERLAFSILEQVADAIVVCDLDERIIRASQSAERLAGRSILLERFRDVLPIQIGEGGVPEGERLLGRVLGGETCSAVEAVLPSAEARQGDSCWMRLSIGAGPLRGTSGQIIGAVLSLTDVTERRRAEEELLAVRDDLQCANEDLNAANIGLESVTAELRSSNEKLDQRVRERTARLRELAGELTRAEDRERQRIALLLHDDLQQLLFGAQLHLDSATRADSGAPGRAALDQVRRLISESFDVARGLTHELSPTALHHGSLKEGLRWLGESMQKIHGLHVCVHSSGNPELRDENTRFLLYQAVRELLLNVVRHAGVNEAQVLVRSSGPDVQIVVTDAGRGFDPSVYAETSSPTAGLGLFSIRERLILVGGRMEIESALGEGTHVQVFAPALLRKAEGGEGGAG